LGACRAPPGERYLLPAAFDGCILVNYGVSGAPALPIEDGFVVIRVSEGRPIAWERPSPRRPRFVVDTSTSMPKGEWRRQEVLYELPGRRVPANVVRNGGWSNAMSKEVCFSPKP
jgi:hypothetical protein